MIDNYSLLIDAVSSARSQAVSLLPKGRGNYIGMLPKNSYESVEVKEFSSVITYSPAELMLSVQAGASLFDIQQLLDENRQRVCCSFRNLSGLFGDYQKHTSLGGALSLGFSGSDRINHYAIRDSVLGLTLINAYAEQIQAGGKVFKNVTGYDWGKLLIGAMGSLGIIAQVQLRLRPLAETEVSMIFATHSIEDAIALMAKALNSPYDIVGAATFLEDDLWQVVLRLEGEGTSVQERQTFLQAHLHPPKDVMAGDASYVWWQEYNDMRVFDRKNTQDNVWLFSQPQSKASQLVKALKEIDPKGIIRLDWGGAQVWWSSKWEYSIENFRKKIPLNTSIRPIRQANTVLRLIENLDPVKEKVLKKLYLNLDPEGVFSPLNPYGLNLG